jgi:hypothetical protein
MTPKLKEIVWFVISNANAGVYRIDIKDVKKWIEKNKK